MRTACFAGKSVLLAGKWQVPFVKPFVSADMRKDILLDTQEVTDSSSVEPTIFFSHIHKGPANLPAYTSQMRRS
jgi:hypothetical protein